MQILLDAQALLEPLAGVGRCSKSFLTALARIDSENQYYLYYGASLRQRGQTLPDFNRANFHRKLLRFPGKAFRLLTEKVRLLPVGRFLKGDIFHGLNYYVPGVSFPSLVNIYDLSFILFPQHFTRRRLKDIGEKVKYSVRRVDKIITGSISSKKDIVKLLGVPHEKVRVMPFGVDENFTVLSQDDVMNFRRKNNLPQKYILFVGTLEPRKNIVSLIRAYRDLGRFDFNLVIAGKRGWLFEEVFLEVEKLNLKGKVIFTGYIPDNELALLYNGATLFVYPSFYEGFGFPPLEALACGVPVIASRASSIPEVVGEAAMLVEPDDVSGLRSAMAVFLDDDSLREKMIRRGLSQAGKFSWESCARETLKLYEELV